jgi:hypothetical protein
VRFPPAEKNYIDQAAAADGLSRSEWLRRCVAESRARQGLPPTVEDPEVMAAVAAIARWAAAAKEAKT